MKVYLAGPMRGCKKLNFPAFAKYAKKLRRLGFTVFSPAEKGAEVEVTNDPTLQDQMAFRRKVFALDTEYICTKADAVALMPGWEQSAGARAEAALAQAIGLKVFEV